MSSYNSYSPGTTFLDSITTGGFLQYGNGATGVPTGVTMVYSWRPKPASNLLNLPDNNPGFATPQGAYVDLSQSKLTDAFTVVNYEVPIDVCRTIVVTASQSFNVFISGRDFYGQKMTCGGASQLIDAEQAFPTPRGFSAITSIKVSGSAGLNAVQIQTINAIELPFADYNGAAISFINYDQKPLYCIKEEAEPPYTLKALYEYLPSSVGQTLSENNPRPLLLLANIGDDAPAPFDGIKEIVIGQNATGYGFNKPIPQSEGISADFTLQEQNQFLNLSTYVMGEPSYNIGWVGWQS